MIFVFSFLIICIFSQQNSPVEKKTVGYIYAFFFISFVLAIIPGLRYEWGADYFNYKNLYEYEHIVPSIEIIYFYVSFFSHKIGIHYNLFLFIMAIFSVGIKLKFYYKWTQYPFYALIPYLALIYSVYELGFVRQALALALVCLSYDAYFIKKKLSAFIFAFISCLCQFSTSIIFLIYLIDGIIPKNVKSKIVPILLISISVFWFSNSLPDIVLKYTSNLEKNYVIDKIRYYLINYPGTGLSFNVLRAFGMLYIFNKRCKNIQLLRLYNIGALIYFLSTCNAQFATRFNSVYFILEPLLVDDILKHTSSKSQFWVKSMFTILYFVLFVYCIFLFDYTNYKSILSLF